MLMLAADYDTAWSGLNSKLKVHEKSSGSLADVLLELESHQKFSGLIQDDLASIRRYSFVHHEHPARYLRLQFNPRRASRFVGAGIIMPPQGLSPINGGCSLCRDNVLWQQQGKEIGYEIEVGTNKYYAWMNPFPLSPCHTVISTRDHCAQEWELHPYGKLPLERLIGDLVELARRLPGFIGFYNGLNAGATIPGHMHYQFFKRPGEDMRFPLEQAERDFTYFDDTGIVRHYPLSVAVWQGDPDRIASLAIEWVRYWADQNITHMHHLTGNFIVTTDPDTHEISLFFAPRDRRRSRSYSITELVGGLETLGEIVFSSEAERIAISNGHVSYENLAKIYSDVYTPFFIDKPGHLDREL